MADYGDGNRHAATLGQFVGQIVDGGAGCVIYRQVSVTPHQDNQISIKWEVIAVAEGQVKKAIEQYKCETIHKTLVALLNAGLTS